jgi:hypothetical protein
MSYDEELARQRADQDADRYSGAGAAIDAAGCLPGVAGLVAAAVIGVASFVHWLLRRRPRQAPR